MNYINYLLDPMLLTDELPNIQKYKTILSATHL